jgi:hypothetical protein
VAAKADGAFRMKQKAEKSSYISQNTKTVKRADRVPKAMR